MLESVAEEKVIIDNHSNALDNLISRLDSATPEQIEECKQLLLEALDLLQCCLDKAEIEKTQVIDEIVKVKKTNCTKKHLETYKNLKET